MDADYVVYEKGSSNSFGKSLLPEEVIIPIKKNGDVENATPFGASMGSVLKEDAAADEVKEDVAILGVIPGSFLEPAVIEGNQLSIDDSMKVIANDTVKQCFYVCQTR